MTFYIVNSHGRHQNYEWTQKELWSEQKLGLSQNVFYISDSHPLLWLLLYTLGILSISFRRSSLELVFQQPWRSSHRCRSACWPFCLYPAVHILSKLSLRSGDPIWGAVMLPCLRLVTQMIFSSAAEVTFGFPFLGPFLKWAGCVVVVLWLRLRKNITDVSPQLSAKASDRYMLICLVLL